MPDSRRGIYCLGNALVDYEFKIGLDQLEKIGITKGQMTFGDDAKFEETFDFLSKEQEFLREGGGSAINSLVTYCRLGGATGLSCIVGQDESGEFLLQEFRRLGIDVHQVSSDVKLATGRCLAMITPDKDRTMMTNLGINEELYSEEDFTPTLQRFSVFYAESYLLALPNSYKFLQAHLRQARNQGIFIALTMSDLSMVIHCRPQMQELLSSGKVDLLFGNYDEYSEYTGEQDLAKIFDFFPKNIKCMVLTKGVEGAFVYDRTKAGTAIQNYPAVNTQVEDTLGAGDTYAGAFLYALCDVGLPHKDAANFAAHAASLVISRMGPRLNQQECDQLLQLLG